MSPKILLLTAAISVSLSVGIQLMLYEEDSPPKFIRDEIRKAELLRELKELGWTESKGVLDLPLDSAIIYLKGQPDLKVSEL